MKIWKRCVGLVLALACCLGLLSGCGQEAAEGMKLSVCVGSAPRELDPIYATDPADQTILMHLYENLMRTAVDASGGTSASSGVAKSVQQEENTDGTVTCTFKLRGAKWSDGQAVTASDFVYAWQRLADPANDSPYASLLSVVAGYDTVRSTGDVTALKVSAKNDSTLVVELNGKYDWFLTVVCTSPATLPVRQDVIEAWQTQTAEAAAQAEEEPVEVEPWWADPSGFVTNGPYQVSGETDDALTLTASETYSGTQSGPAELTFRYADTPEEAQSLYENKEVDFVSRVTDDQLAKLVEEESPSLIQELGVYTILFNCRQEQLADPQVRGALVLSLDRAAIAEAAGETARAAEGFIAPGVPENEDGDFRTVGGPVVETDPEEYQASCVEAQKLLNAAADGAPTGLEYLYVDEGTAGDVAREVCDAWSRVLGVTVTPKSVTAEELETALRTGEYDLAATTFQPLGNDAECFLRPWMTDSGENVLGYANSAYDTLMSIIASASDSAARMGCLHDAEELLLGDYALTPLYTTVTADQLRENLTGVCRDPRGWFSFTSVAVRTA